MSAGLIASVDYAYEKGVVRTGTCPVHRHVTTSRFVGVNERGWVFKCWEADGHYFVNPPPAGER